MSERLHRHHSALVPVAISLSLLLYATYYVSSTPPQPLRRKLVIHPGLASLPESHRAREIYPEEFYQGGSYVDLPFGRTRYWLLRPEAVESHDDTVRIVLIHGLLTPSIQWAQLAPALAEKGFEVLVYDLYGRGYSDAPDTIHNAELYITQLALLMRHVGWKRAILCGVSLGGGIAAAFARAFPKMVEREIILISSAGIMEDEDRTRAISYMPRSISDHYFPKSPFKRMLNSLPSLKATRKGPLDLITEFIHLQCSALPQHVKAAVSSLRDGPVSDLTSTFGSEQFEEKKVQIIQGTNDPIVPFKYSGLILSALPPSSQRLSKIITIPGGGHDLPLTHAADLANEISCFFAGRSSGIHSRLSSPVSD
ncbi:Alpha/Beta hydrolase protein [Cyathus striatus]|nr:Alpha/Beta hydrolase protein [Cyathus striatus]